MYCGEFFFYYNFLNLQDHEAASEHSLLFCQNMESYSPEFQVNARYAYKHTLFVMYISKMVAETRVEMSNSCLMLMNFHFLYSVHAKMNVHEHRPKQTYESYTFEPLMSF